MNAGKIASLGRIVALGLLALALPPAASSEEALKMGAAQLRLTASVAPALADGVAAEGAQADLSASGLALRRVCPSLTEPTVLQLDVLGTGEVKSKSILDTKLFTRPGAAAFSPGGGQVAFCGTREDAGHAATVSPWIVNADGGGLRQLRHDEYDYAGIQWRPDGQALAVHRTRHSDPLVGETVLLSALTGEVLSALKQDLTQLRFTPDGRWLVGSDHGRLAAVDLASGEERVLWDPKGATAPSQGAPTFFAGPATCLPEGRHVLFSVGHRDFTVHGGPVAWEIWEADLQGQQPARRVSEGRIAASSLDGRSVLIDSRPVATIAARRAAKRPEVEVGEVNLFAVSAIGE